MNLRKKRLIIVSAAAALLLAAGTASGLALRAGDLVINADGGFSPKSLPRTENAPITLFNGSPKNGDPTVLAHAYLSVPAPTAYIGPVVIETIHNGLYGYRVDVKIPPIAGGYGIPISAKGKVGRKWTFGGEQHSFLNARCEAGHLQARGKFSFDNGTALTGTIVRPCKVRGGEG